MGVPTMMAGSIRNILLGAIEVKREEFQDGKSIDEIKQDLIEEGFSENNIKRILTEVQDNPIEETIPADMIKDAYKLKENSYKVILYKNPELKMQDYIRFRGRDYVVQQINDFGNEVELLIKNYS